MKWRREEVRRNVGIITIIGRVPNLYIISQKNPLTYRDIGIRLMALCDRQNLQL